jgi:hypothetical protein
MTTILILNAASSLVAAAGLGGYVLRARRRAERELAASTLYLNTARRR